MTDRMLNPTNKHFQFVKHLGILFVPLCANCELFVVFTICALILHVLGNS